MKKYLAIILAILLVLSLSACNREEVPIESQHSQSEIESPPVEDDDENSEDFENAPSSSSEDAGLIDPSSSGQFMGGGIEGGDGNLADVPVTPPEVSGGDSPNLQLASMIKTVRSSDENDALEIWVNPESERLQMLQDSYGFNLEDFDEYAISYSPMNVKAYMVAIIKPKDGKEDDLVKAFTNWTEGKTKEFDQYLPDQKAIASSAQLGEKGGYYIYCMCENAMDLSEALIAQVEAKIDFEAGPVTDEKATGNDDTSTGNDEAGNLAVD